MTVSLNTVTSNAAYQPYVPTAAPAAATAAAELSSQAVTLSAQSAVVASLGGSTGATVYSPAGLLNTLQQAGQTEETIATPKEGSNVDTSNTAQLAQDQNILSSLAESATSSGVYTGTGAISTTLSEQAASNWAELLKTNPSLAGTVISSSYDMGIVNLLSVTA
ncbi:hypothetical protein GTP58_22025 [Duganella sp. CY15W]|uniref:hypothetical protein n=1 Tax=Duganella sp. CY15W TaxID=2692172 RepID=UPI00136EEE87|nr:hypothetical protein [Duganella sp. CY15W]MYM31021.1 hypothetical protein [Duganella sp. CY15W]